MEPPRNGSFSQFNPILIQVNIPEKGMTTFTIQRPDDARVRATVDVAKKIFVDAFSIHYTRYYNADENKSEGSIEKWLKLKSELKEWLSSTFDEEYQEYQSGKKGFIHLYDSQNNLVGWLSHSQVDEKGDMYLSQCSLEAVWSDQKISTTAFNEFINNDRFPVIFPDVKELKLIVRKINKVAQKLYARAGFTCDETIKPEVYGDSYDERYVGYRRRVNP